MPSIQSSPHPLAFPAANASQAGFTAPASEERVFTYARALEGMQKEALVGRPGRAWRLVCDEGPYLNGTDLAPFPLAFFTAGMAAGFLAAAEAALGTRGTEVRGLQLTQDNRYSMQGSALGGTMRGGSLPVALALEGEGLAPALAREILAQAVDAFPAGALLKQSLISEFALFHNGAPLAPDRVPALPREALPGLPEGFDALRPSEGGEWPRDIIVKNAAADSVAGVEGGAGSSLRADQKRNLHVRGICSRRADGLLEIQVHLFQPLGSQFRFLADPAGERAPDGADYLSAGLAFCYLTQIGRYTQILKKPLERYRILQETDFSAAANGPAGMAPVRTRVELDSPQGEDFSRQVVDMGEQTCFLHAACRETPGLEFKDKLEEK